MRVDAGDVDHAGVHADISDDRGFPAVDDEAPFSAAKPAVQAVGIADRDGRRTHGMLCDDSVAAVADRIADRNLFDLDDAAFERADRQQVLLVGDADAVQSDAEPYHVELRFREALDPGAVVDVPQDVPLREGGDQPVAQFAEQGDLAAREVVVPGFVATG